jgi:hypothetical protein
MAGTVGFAISFIRTVTVGSSIAPDLLTLQAAPKNGTTGASGLLLAFQPTNTAGGEFRPALRTLSAPKVIRGRRVRF